MELTHNYPMSISLSKKALTDLRGLTDLQIDLFLHLALRMKEKNRIYFPIKDIGWGKKQAARTKCVKYYVMRRTFYALIEKDFIFFTDKEDEFILNPRYIQLVNS